MFNPNYIVQKYSDSNCTFINDRSIGSILGPDFQLAALQAWTDKPTDNAILGVGYQVDVKVNICNI